MATLTIRNVPTKVVRALKAQAERNRRSMEQEVRDIIEAQVGDRASAIAQIERAWRSQKRSPKADEIEAWVDQLATSYQILPMDTSCFREWGRLMDGKPDQLVEDGMIAATARVHRLIIATRNERDFRLLNVRFINPFKSG